ncbi:unnamed protein product, partial [Fusarium fujikuroi]
VELASHSVDTASAPPLLSPELLRLFISKSLLKLAFLDGITDRWSSRVVTIEDCSQMRPVVTKDYYSTEYDLIRLIALLCCQGESHCLGMQAGLLCRLRRLSALKACWGSIPLQHDFSLNVEAGADLRLHPIALRLR